MTQPFSAKDPLESLAGPSADRCSHCLSPGMRRSRWRGEDFFRLLLLQWPMRCMECRKRQYGSFAAARRSVAAALAHAGTFKSPETWQDFTGSVPQQSSEAQPVQRDKDAPA